MRFWKWIWWFFSTSGMTIDEMVMYYKLTVNERRAGQMEYEDPYLDIGGEG